MIVGFTSFKHFSFQSRPDRSVWSMSPARSSESAASSACQHTQVGYVTGTALALGGLIADASFRSEGEALGWMGLATVGTFGVGVLLFSSLTVTVDDEELRFYFGPGFWERRIPLSDIRKVRVVRNAAWYGWGIRYTPHGWFYTVSGLQAAELTVRDQGTLRIGTDEPERLKRAVEQARVGA